jgi:hypothetical protein
VSDDVFARVRAQVAELADLRQQLRAMARCPDDTRDLLRELKAAVYAESVMLRKACPVREIPRERAVNRALEYRLDVTCPRCGELLEHVTDGTSNGASTRAISRCTACRAGWLITATIQQVGAAVHA